MGSQVAVASERRRVLKNGMTAPYLWVACACRLGSRGPFKHGQIVLNVGGQLGWQLFDIYFFK